jgi:hypothetical protein
MIEGKNKKEIRSIEMALLKPRPIEEYKGAKAGPSQYKKRTIILTFPNEKWVERLGEFIKINSYIENNSYDIDFLLEMIKLMEKERIVFDKDKKKFYKINRKGIKVRL